MSLYLNFRAKFTNSGGHTKSFKFLPVKLNSYPEISVHFLFKFELDVDSFGSRRGVMPLGPKMGQPGVTCFT